MKNSISIKRAWSGIKSIALKFVYQIGELFNHLIDLGVKKKNELKFYTEFPSGIISPVFHQLPLKKYLVLEGIKDKRIIKKMRALNLFVMVHASAFKNSQK